MGRKARVSPDRILAAAEVEFAARGFAGARVDRIARRARVNKAMIYYHFRSKQELYRALLRRMFQTIGDRLREVAASDDSPAAKIDRVVATLAELVGEHAHLPAVMLREIADGGARLDRDTLAALAALPAVVAGIVQQGVTEGAFRPVPPIFAYFAMVAPIIFYRASAPIRAEVTDLHLVDLRLTPEAFVHHMQEAQRRILAGAGPSRSRPTS